jgi:hypothetical protein
MRKIIKLNESDLLKIVNKVIKAKKNLINEDAVGKEPILRGPIGTGTFYFDKGATVPNMWNGQKVSEAVRKNLVQAVSEIIDYNFQAIEKFFDDDVNKLPVFIKINVGTDATGSDAENASVGQGRIDYFTKLIEDAFIKGGYRADMAKRFVVGNSKSDYQPAKVNRNLKDPTKVPEDAKLRFARVTLFQLEVMGLDTKDIQNVQGELNAASSIINTGFLDLVDEDRIERALMAIKTYSDIIDLNDAIAAQRDARFNSLEGFLNSQLFDDMDTLHSIADTLDQACRRSELQKGTVRVVGDKISINLRAK